MDLLTTVLILIYKHLSQARHDLEVVLYQLTPLPGAWGKESFQRKVSCCWRGCSWVMGSMVNILACAPFCTLLLLKLLAVHIHFLYLTAVSSNLFSSQSRRGEWLMVLVGILNWRIQFLKYDNTFANKTPGK